MTVQEMARTAIGLAADDEAALEHWAGVEEAAFEAYLSDYMSAGVAVCKGCHGG